MLKTIWRECLVCQWTMGFMERESEDRLSSVLVIRERRHKMTWAMLVPRKGTEIPWRSSSINSGTLRCDNEPAIEALAREIAQARQEGSQTLPERPAVGKVSPMGSSNASIA